jgi:hypothetical protein
MAVESEKMGTGYQRPVPISAAARELLQGEQDLFRGWYILGPQLGFGPALRQLV